MHYENATKCGKKNVLIHLSLFLKETPNLQTREVPKYFVVELCGYQYLKYQIFSRRFS